MEITYKDNTKEHVEIVVQVDHNKVVLVGKESKDIYLEVKFPFKLSKIPPDYLDVNKDCEHSLVFKNRYFSEFDVCEMKDGGSNHKPRLGYLFKPSIIFNQESTFIFEEDKYLQIAIYRGIVSLLNDRGSALPRSLVVKRETNFKFFDFFSNDTIIGVFPIEFNKNFNESRRMEVLFNLYLYGFYFINKQLDFDFNPPSNEYQKNAFGLLKFHKTNFRRYLDIKSVSTKVKETIYCSHYITELVKENVNEISKFHQIYGLVEIFKDLVLKYEIKEKIATRLVDPSINGHKLHTDFLEMTRDNYSIGKLFTKYSKTDDSDIQSISIDIYMFLDAYRRKDEVKSLDNFAQCIYFLRNIIVHDIQFIFAKDVEQSQKIRAHLLDIVFQIEYAIISVIGSLEIH
jgi:hypothetical protein